MGTDDGMGTGGNRIGPPMHIWGEGGPTAWDGILRAAAQLEARGYRVQTHCCGDGGCDASLLARCLRLLLGAAEEGGMPTSRADAIHAEVMASVLALDGRGRDADQECGAALDALWGELHDDDDDDDEEDYPCREFT